MKLKQQGLEPLAGKLFEYDRTLKSGKVVREKVLIVLPSTHDLDQARLMAVAYVEELDPLRIVVRRDELVEQQETIEVLMRALRDPMQPGRLWAGTNEIRAKLSAREVAMLSDAYLEYERECVRRVTPRPEEDEVVTYHDEVIA